MREGRLDAGVVAIQRLMKSSTDCLHGKVGSTTLSGWPRFLWAPVLRALAHEERLLIALWLAEGECSVRELEQVTGLGQSLVSYHLRELREAGLVVASARVRSNRYRLAHAELDQLAALIGTLEPAG